MTPQQVDSLIIGPIIAARCISPCFITKLISASVRALAKNPISSKACCCHVARACTDPNQYFTGIGITRLTGEEDCLIKNIWSG